MSNDRTLDMVKRSLIQRLQVVRGEIVAERADDAQARAGDDMLDARDIGEIASRKSLIGPRDAQEAVPESEALDLEAALQRVADGTYGICVDCDERIPAARLAAEPAGARCLSCQLAFEAAVAHY